LASVTSKLGWLGVRVEFVAGKSIRGFRWSKVGRRGPETRASPAAGDGHCRARVSRLSRKLRHQVGI